MISRKRWDVGANPLEMLNSVFESFTRRDQAQARDRKLQLYMLALCRMDWDGSPWLCKKIIELSEAALEGTFSTATLRQPLEYIAEGLALAVTTYRDVQLAWIGDYERYLLELGHEKPADADANIDFRDIRRLGQASLTYRATSPFYSRSYQQILREQHSVLHIRDIFGNPFRPVSFSDSWRTTTAVSIAKGMYDSRDFAAMPLLADALEDAGCNQADILDHCRGSGPHARGCWVVDLVLGKS